jgi:hypothetical protein
MENIMKVNTLAIILCMISVIFSCRDSAKDIPAGKRIDSNPRQPLDTQHNFDSLLSLILSLQNAVAANPASAELTVKLKSAALDTPNGGFLTAGTGVFNPEFPEGAKEQGRIRSARYTGERWALYLKAWHTGTNLAFGNPVSGAITFSRELLSRESGDTLYQLLLVPVGSVVLDEPEKVLIQEKKRVKKR